MCMECASEVSPRAIVATTDGLVIIATRQQAMRPCRMSTRTRRRTIPTMVFISRNRLRMNAKQDKLLTKRRLSKPVINHRINLYIIKNVAMKSSKAAKYRNQRKSTMMTCGANAHTKEQPSNSRFITHKKPLTCMRQ